MSLVLQIALFVAAGLVASPAAADSAIDQQCKANAALGARPDCGDNCLWAPCHCTPSVSYCRASRTLIVVGLPQGCTIHWQILHPLVITLIVVGVAVLILFTLITCCRR